MRKVTGYIGALIVVVALMGSILAGYALNINGQSTVVNEYENVTDVSGLYSHTDQKTYIDYNPASNYIEYNLDTASFDNLTGTHEYRSITKNNTVVKYRGSDRHCLIDGVDQGVMSIARFYIISDMMAVYAESNGLTMYRHNGSNVVASLNDDATFTINNKTISASIGGNNYTISNNNLILAYATINADYYVQLGPTKNNVYLNDKNQIMAWITGDTGILHGTTINGINTEYGTTSTLNIFSGESNAAPGIKKYSTVGLSSGSKTTWAIFYPKSVNNGTGTGIDYTESNRVNNYIIGYRNIGGTPVTTSSRIDLQNVSTYNYATPNKSWIMDEGWTDFDEHYNPIWDWQLKAPSTYTVYTFTDLLTSLSVPANTINVTLKIPMVMAGNSYYASPFLRTIWDWPDGSDLTMVSNMPYNLVMIGNNAGTYDYKVSDTQYGINGTISNNNLFRTASYDVSTGLVNIYDYNGTKVLTDSVSNIYIQYLKNPGVTGYVDSINRNTAAHVTDTYTINYRNDSYQYQTTSPVSIMDVDITTSTSTSVPIYMDITKGIKIDPANVPDTIWNNEYENGTVKLLFRAEDTYGTYHNEFSVSNNTISVDYTGSRFFITLNGAEQIDIGAWRSIILNIDMLNGEVFVNPVRTFNSYTNISADKATIFIGDTINNTPITSISWKPTVNSFTFGVYATDVFLNTYGVVMVNPSLTITNYFTDLNNFYRLVLNNFSTYGDSITVNGVTGNVSGNTVTFNDETITLKNLEIIYADGHVYVEDDNDSVDLGTIANNDISLSGVWYFETDLDRGYTTTKQIYTWDWQDFILDNTQFCIFYIGMALVGLVVARRFCIMTVIDYAVFITSIIIALSTQVIA